MKLHQCVLMDNVTVQDGVTLQNTVVAPHASIQVMNNTIVGLCSRACWVDLRGLASTQQNAVVGLCSRACWVEGAGIQVTKRGRRSV